MSKQATIYYKNMVVYIFGQSRTVNGVWICSSDMKSVSIENLEEIGKATEFLMNSTMINIKHPSQAEWISANKEFLELLGYGSFSTFMKGAKCINVYSDNNNITLIYTKNEGARGGFTPMGEYSFEFNDDFHSLGEEILKGVPLSR